MRHFLPSCRYSRPRHSHSHVLKNKVGKNVASLEIILRPARSEMCELNCFLASGRLAGLSQTRQGARRSRRLFVWDTGEIYNKSWTVPIRVSLRSLNLYVINSRLLTFTDLSEVPCIRILEALIKCLHFSVLMSLS